MDIKIFIYGIFCFLYGKYEDKMISFIKSKVFKK